MNTKYLKFSTIIVALVVLAGIIFVLKNLKPSPSYIPQFVLISFDGSNSIDTWKDLREFKLEMKKQKRPINFTYFINAAYFLTPGEKSLYKGPDHEVGISNIGFALSAPDVKARIEEVNRAVKDGDEIASHTVGHFSGTGWTKEQWKEEFALFDRILFSQPKLHLARRDVVGFRAPYLDTSPGLFDALHENNFTYDSSEIGTGDAWPTKDAQGMWRIKMGTLAVGPYKTPVLAMDYNLYVHDTQATSLLKKGTPEWKKSYDDTLAALLEYFNRNYSGRRAPVLIGYHFSMLWNDGVYWEAMKEFARQVCRKPEVRCGTFRELVEYMEK